MDTIPFRLICDFQSIQIKILIYNPEFCGFYFKFQSITAKGVFFFILQQITVKIMRRYFIQEVFRNSVYFFIFKGKT